MNRTQLAILAAVGTAAGLAWTAVLMHSVVDGVADEAVASPPARSSVAPPTDADGDSPRVTVPPELRTRTIDLGERSQAPRGGVVDDVADGPGAVGAALVRTMWTYDTRIDTTSHDAAARAALWATDRLASVLARPAIRATPQWDEWSRDDVYSRVGVQRSTTPGQDVETADQLRTYQVDVRVVGNDGYHDQLEPFLVTATLVNGDRRWLVEGITLA